MTEKTELFARAQSIIDALEIPHQWHETIDKQLSKIGDSVADADKRGRVDLRQKPFITIDGETAKDFDDAVYCQHLEDQFILSVAIADVSHYVDIGSALDREALLRSNSVYFEHQVIPMLPEKISNGLCSLVPNVDRLVLAVDITIDAKGKIQSYCFYDALICSQARLTYTQVSEVIKTTTSKSKSTLPTEILDNIANLYRVFQILQKARVQRGAMEFETLETQLIFNANYKVKSIEAVQRNDAHKLIEEAMLAANYCAADLLLKHQTPSLYRNHLPPDPQKLENLRHFLRSRGLLLTGGESPQPSDFQQLGKKITNQPSAQIVFSMMLRAQQQANYCPENKGHFGLSLERYTHFTSPIRRYSDLVVHRTIRSIINTKKGKSQNNSSANSDSVKHNRQHPKLVNCYQPEQLDAIAEQCSNNERRAEDATRQLTQWLKCQYLTQFIGDTFVCTITSVTNFGLFVNLENINVDGLIHISNLAKEFFEFDPIRHSLQGRKSGAEFSIGQRLSVRVASVNMDNCKIDFLLASASTHSNNRQRTTKRGKFGRRRGSHQKS